MRKRWIGLLLLVLFGGIVWQNKIDLIVWALPKAQSLAQPTAANRPIAWQAGPEVAALAPAERPPNIILVLTDDMGFNDISLYNGGAADGTLMTPHIDALAQQGVTFTSGYAANAVRRLGHQCLPVAIPHASVSSSLRFSRSAHF
jgi:uncharacterized sulfatase